MKGVMGLGSRVVRSGGKGSGAVGRPGVLGYVRFNLSMLLDN